MTAAPERRPSPALGRWATDRRVGLMLVALAVVPFLLSDPGRVAADTRQYLYIDPGAFLRRAVSLWDPSFAAGTVPHQHLGLLWPMGSWFWLADTVGLPVWVAQRLWMAGIAVVAGLGAHRLARRWGLGAAASVVAAVAYQLTPYQLAFTARLSVLLLPWAALPWLVLLALRSVRERSWRAPLAFGLVASTAGAANASSLVLVLLAPALVLASAAASGSVRSAMAAGVRISVATLGASAWWLAGLVVQGRHGLPVLQLTENVDTVAAASAPDDVVRGLGNWIFTSTDGATTAIDQAAAYAHSPIVRIATIALPAVAIGVLAAVRFRGRLLLAAMLGMGTIVAAGPAPLGDSSAYGRLWRRFSDSSSIGLALRNTPRVVPVVVLATVLAIAIGIDRFAGRRRTIAAGAAIAVALVALAPVARHGYLSDDFDRPSAIPDHWLAIADDLDAAASADGTGGGRVLELPGANFAVYDWGNTVEPVLTGLVDRPTLAREVLPSGGPGVTDLLGALDRRLQRDTLDPAALAPVARLLGAADVVIRGDIDHDRFGLPDPGRLVRRYLADPPPGFRVTGSYGGSGDDPLLLRLTLDDPAPRLRLDPTPPVLLAGNGDGIVDAAAAGLIDGRRVVLQTALAPPAARDDAIDRGSQVIITDTNRKRATTFFYTIADDVGATESADRREPDPTGYDIRFGPLANASPDEQTVALQIGGTVTATQSGGPERPADRAVHAFDGDRATAWRPAVPIGQRIDATFDEPVAADSVTLHAAPGPARVTAVTVVVDGRRIDVDLDERAGTAGQAVPIPGGPVRSLTVEITAAVGPGPAGFTEIRLGEAVVDEALRPPVALVDHLATTKSEVPVHVVLTRDQGDRSDPDGAPVETDIDRLVRFPSVARFEITASGTVDGAVPAGCVGGLVSVDGADVAVLIRAGDRRPGGAGPVPVVLTGCDPLTLAAGDHRITTASTTGGTVDVDRIVLRHVGAPDPAGADRGPEAAALDVGLDVGRSADRRLDATAVIGNGPVWLVLAESRNDGWSLDVDGATVLAEATVDGYANGWLLEPSGPGRASVALRWTPQRIVWGGMAVSAIAVAVALVVLLRRGRDPDDGPLRPTEPRPARAVRRHAATSILSIGAVAAGVWFVAGTAVAVVVTVLAVVRRTVAPSRLPLAAVAAASVVTAELTDRPSLVFLGLAVVLVDLVVGEGQEPEDARTVAPG